MKKLFILFLMNCAIINLFAQNYQIVFSGSGASSIVDSVKVRNLMSGTVVTLAGGDTLQLIGLVKVNELNVISEKGLLLYPNPSSDICMFSFYAENEGNVLIELLDMNGKTILHTQSYLSKGRHEYHLNNVGSGVYTLNVKSAKYGYAAKVISNNTLSNTPKIKYIGLGSNTYAENDNNILKSSKSIVSMPFNTGDTLLVTGESGIYGTSALFVPTQSQTYNFDFMASTDIDGNNYTVVQVGTQTWMIENLKTTTYRDGSPITNVTDATAWSTLTTQAYCDYDNNPANGLLYGRLYNWKAVTDTRKVCPVGWRLPTEAEITILQNYLGGFLVAGGKLKETGTTHWETPNVGATNETGFTAIASGNRGYDGGFNVLGISGWWWTSSTGGTSWAYYFSMYSDSAKLDMFTYNKKCGFAVRCVKE